MIKNQIISNDSINNLANKEIKTNLKTMLLALEMGKRSTWQYAIAVSKILDGNQFKEDFHDLKTFAEYVNSSKATLSQYANAVKFMEREQLFAVKETKKGGNVIDLSATPLNVFNAYLLSTLSLDEYQNFYDYCVNNGIDFMMLSQNKLKALLKEWREELNTVDAIATEETTEATEEQEAPEHVNLNVDTKEKALTTISALVKQFNISIEEICEQLDY